MRWIARLGKNTGCPSNFEFQINNEVGAILIRGKIINYLKFKFIWHPIFYLATL